MEVHQDRAGTLAAPITGTIYEGTVARIHPDGDPLRYGPDHVEYRDRAGLDEINAELQTPRSFTLLHPDNLISRGAKADIVGQVIGSRIEGDFVIAKILVTDQRGIDAINAGIHELSLGYLATLDANRRQRNIKIDHLALVPKGRCLTCSLRADCAGDCNNCAISYTTGAVAEQPIIDAVLTAKTRHELASSMFAAPASEALPLEDESHVQNAMARFNQTIFKGPAEKKAAFHHIIARAHQLGMDASGFEKKYGNLDQGTPVMDELTKKLTEALAEAASQKARADALDTSLTAAKTALTAAEVLATNAQAALTAEKASNLTAITAEKTRADAAEETAKKSLEQAKLDADASLVTAVKARVLLETRANAILGAKDKDGKSIDRSALSERDIKIAVIKHVDAMDVPADKVMAYVDGVYEGSITRAQSAASSIASTRSVIEATRKDHAPVGTGTVATGPDAERVARQEMADRKRAGKA